MRATLDAHDDDALLARMRAGDEVAFRTLVDRHRPWLVRLCTRLLGHDAHAAEDAAQESLLKLHAAARRDGRPLRVRWEGDQSILSSLALVNREFCLGLLAAGDVELSLWERVDGWHTLAERDDPRFGPPSWA